MGGREGGGGGGEKERERMKTDKQANTMGLFSLYHSQWSKPIFRSQFQCQFYLRMAWPRSEMQVCALPRLS